MRILLSLMIMSIFPFFITREDITKNTEKESINVAATMEEYCNTRFVFCLDYATALLPQKFISDNGDGVILRSEDDKIVVTVSGSRSVLGRDTRELYNDFIKENLALQADQSKVIYNIIEPPYYEVTYVEDGYQYYQKLYHRGNKYVIFQIVAPVSESDRVNTIKNNIKISYDS